LLHGTIPIGSGWSKLKPARTTRSFPLFVPVNKNPALHEKLRSCSPDHDSDSSSFKKGEQTVTECHAEGSHIHTYHFFESMLIIMQLIVT
jgi:hypothetical protein